MFSQSDVEAEGEPEEEFLIGVAGRSPRKRISGAAYIRSRDGRLLMLSPVYKPGWELPGGICEDNETPRDAAVREVEEEIGLRIRMGNLLVVDWVPKHGLWGDALHFVFDGGVIAEESISALVLQSEEIGGANLATMREISDHVRPSMHRRLTLAQQALDGGLTLYGEFGRLPG